MAHGRRESHSGLIRCGRAARWKTFGTGLTKADPSCSEGYPPQCGAYTTQLRSLNTELAGQAQALSRARTFVAFHDFAPNFAERFGLKAEYLGTCPR